MKYCPLCAKNYEDEAGVCEVDGATLKISGKIDPYLGKLIRGRYQVHKKLGEGGMGTVYLAEQMSVGRKVALKVLHGTYATDEEFIGRFRREARLAASLSHPNIVTLYDFDQADDGSLFIAMEYLPGHKLSDVIRRDGPLEIKRASRLALQIAEGLGAAHRAGVIHRDIKPDNIMVVGENGSEEIKLMDFGIARLRDGTSTTQLTRSGLIMGTPAYMAPEQAEGIEVSEKTDVYALGIVLYEMLSGTVPFKASTPAAVLVKQIQEAPVPLRKLRRDLPTGLERTIMQALEKQPDRRQKNADEVADQLSKLAEKLRTDGATKGWAPTRTWNPFKKAPQEKIEAPENNAWEIGKTVVNHEPALPTEVVAAPYAATQVISGDSVTVYIPKPTWPAVKWVKAFSAALIGCAALIALVLFLNRWTAAPELVSMAIKSHTNTLAPRERLTLEVTGTYSDGDVHSISSGLDWHSSDNSVASVSPQGEVEAQNAGTAEITASYKNRVNRSVTLVVKAKTPPPPPAPSLVSLTMLSPKQELKARETISLRLKARYSDGKEKDVNTGITWTSSNDEVASVDSRGRVTGRAGGNARIHASYEQADTELMLTVKEKPVPPPPPPQPDLRLATALYQDGRYQEAISQCDQLLKTYPQNTAVLELRRRAFNACKKEGICK